MANNLKISNAARSAAADAIAALVDAGAAAGKLKIYSGSQPAGPDTAAAGTLLATVTLASTAFGSASSGVATLADPDAVTGVAAGTAAWFRIEDSDGNGVIDGSVGTSGADLNLATTTISVGVSVDISSGGTITMPAS